MEISIQSQGLPEKKHVFDKQNSPFKNGWMPSGKRKKKGASSFIRGKNLLAHMLDVDITVEHLPVAIADRLREILPGWVDDLGGKFNIRQVMELVQLQLLFSKSEYIRQDAIDRIKDRVDGKPVQTTKLLGAKEVEPAEMILPGGRKITI